MSKYLSVTMAQYLSLRARFDSAFGYPNGHTQTYGGLLEHNNGLSEYFMLIEDRCFPFMEAADAGRVVDSLPTSFVQRRAASDDAVTIEHDTEGTVFTIVDGKVGSFYTSIKIDVQTAFNGTTPTLTFPFTSTINIGTAGIQEVVLNQYHPEALVAQTTIGKGGSTAGKVVVTLTGRIVR